MKWSLRQQAMDSQVLAASGDETALSDIRAYIASRKRDRKNKWKTNRKKRIMKRLLTSAAALVLAVTLVGCKNSSPAFYSIATATAVSYGLRNSPETANFLRSVQPIACAVATDSDNLNPAQVLAAIEADAVGTSPEGRAVLTGVLLLFVAAYDSLESNTNAAAVRPYAQAVWCDGFAAGLAGAPAVRARNAPPKTVWPMPRK